MTGKENWKMEHMAQQQLQPPLCLSLAAWKNANIYTAMAA